MKNATISRWTVDLRRQKLRRFSRAIQWLALATCLAIPSRGFGQFGVTSSNGSYTVNTGAGLVFMVNQSSGDITSINFNGVEYQASDKHSQIASGLGSSTVIATNFNNNYILIACATSPSNSVVSSLTHYFIVTNGCNNIFMATYVTAEPAVGELRWITRLNSNLITNGPGPSDIRNTSGNVESTDVFFMPDGTTRSKYYGDAITHGKDRALEYTYSGATGVNVGVWMVYDNPRESSSGGPFFRDIQNQCGVDQEIYNYMNSGHNQTEAYRNNLLHGPYTLVFTTGGLPTSVTSIPIDYSWVETSGLANNILGYVGRAGRGAVKGSTSGIPGGFQTVVGFANAAAQYWAMATNGAYTTPLMKPGTYTVTLYKGELAVASNSVTVAAGATNTLNLVSAEPAPTTIFRIGQWDGTPNGFLNATNVLTMSQPNMITMHPSDVRMNPWGPVTFTVGTDPDSKFPMAQFQGVNNPTTILFNLASNQIANLTLRIGITCAYGSGRPQVTIGSFTSGDPGASTQPNSRSLTIGTYRGNYQLYTYTISSNALVVGTNALGISIISGSGSLGPFLSPAVAFDAVELDINTPAAPTGLTAVAVSACRINLAWTPGSTNQTSFLIERSTNGTSFAQITSVGSSTTNYSDTGLSGGTTFFYRVRATNASGPSDYSSVASDTTRPAPAAPGGLTATATSGGEIDLVWTDNSTDEDGFAIARATDGTNFTQIVTVGANVTNYPDATVFGSTTYYYQVQSFQLCSGSPVNSGGSNIANATTPAASLPDSPSGLTATAVASCQIKLAWTDNATNEINYLVKRSPDGTNFTQIASVGANATNYTDTGLAASTQYYYRVTATNNTGPSGDSNIASDTTTAAPSAPSGLIATAISTNRINLVWTDNSNNEDGFTVERSPDGTNFTLIGAVVANTTNYSDVGLAYLTTYTYRVRAFQLCGNSSAYSAVASATTPAPLPPAAPKGLAAIAGDTQVTLSWWGSAGATGYNVKHSTVNGGPYSLIASNVPGTGAIDTGLGNGTTYYYVVSAVNPGGESPDSGQVGATPGPQPSTAYWTNTVTSPEQAWDINGNWTNTVLFPNAAGASAVMNANIAATQTNFLNEAITVALLGIGDFDGTSRYILAGNGGTLTFDNGTSASAALTQFATSAGDTISAPITLNSDLTVANNSLQSLTLSGGISGSNGLTVAGPGTVVFGAANTYSGGTVLSNGTLRLLVPGSTSTGVVTLAGGTLSLTGGGGISLGNTVNVIAASSLIASNLPTLSGPLFGSNATLNVIIPSGQTFDWNAPVSNRFSGTVAFGNSAGFIRFRTSEQFPNAAFDLGNNTLTLNPRDVPLSVSFGSIAGGPNTVMAGCSVSGSSTAFTRYNVGFNNLSTTFDGRLADGGSGNNRFLAVTKTGSGTWTLTGRNTYSGGTTISNGTLLVDNAGGSATGTGTVTIVSGATLGGTGVVSGAVTVNGTLAPGSGSVGALTISNNLTLNSGAALWYELGANSDQTVVSSNLTLGGTLNISDSGGFAAGTYTLFTYAGKLTTNDTAGILTIGSTPNPSLAYSVDIGTPGLVKLIVGSSTPPVAGFTGSPTSGPAPLTVTFADASSGTITNRLWDFGDGNTLNATVLHPLHIYTTAGTYTVSLTVSGPLGSQTSTRSSYIAVTNPPPPVAGFSANTTNGPAPLAVTFTDSSSGAITNRFWDFGDGKTTNTTAAGLSHTYNAGTYTVALTVSGPGGSDSITRPNYIAAGVRPLAGFNASPTNGPSPLTVNFTDTSTGVITNRFWNFGDGGNSSAVNPNHTYTNSGAYSASLTVFGPYGTNTKTQTNLVSVSANPATWTNANATGNWSTPTSWKPLTIPDLGSEVIFGNAGANALVDNSSRTVGLILFDRSADFSVGATGGASLIINQGIIVASNFQYAISAPVVLGGNNLWSVATGGMLQVSGPVGGTNSLLVSGSGTVSLSGTNTYSGGTIVSNGTLLVDNTGGSGTGTGTVDVASAGTLGGTGVVGGPVTVSGTLEPGGSSVGTLTVNNHLMLADGAVLKYRLGTTSDRTAVSGNLTLGGTLNILDAGGFSGGTYTLFTYGGTLTTNGTSNSLAIGSTPNSNLAYTVDISATGFVKLIVTPPLPPVASFSANPTNGIVPLTVVFTDTSINSITNRAWDFGDGNTTNLTATTLSHTYDTTGLYTVHLTVSGIGGSDAMIRINYIVVQHPGHLVVKPSSLDYGLVTLGQTRSLSFSVINSGDVSLSGTAASAAPFGVTSGSSFSVAGGQTQAVTVTFAPVSDGAFNGSVIFASDGGDSTNAVSGTGLTSGNIGVLPAVLDFGTRVTGTTVQASFVVTNTGGTVVSNGTAAVNGGPFTILSGATFSVAGFGTTNVVVRFAPVSAGGFSNSVVFTTANGGTFTSTVRGAGAIVPVAAFSGSPTNGVAPLAVTFTDSSSGTITNRHWNFGDGTTLDTSGTQPVHTYNSPGLYTVSLTASGPVGNNTSTRTNYILACGYTLSATNASFGMLGGSNTVAVTASSGSCGWSAISNASWIQIVGGSINTAGSAVVSYIVLSNTGSSATRVGTMTIAGQTFTVTQAGDTVPPTVALTAPVPDIVSNAIAVSATAADNVAVVKVELYRDGGVLLGTVTTPPYNLNFNTATVGDGSHCFYAKAYDPANNVGWSPTNCVTVNNQAPSVPSGLTATAVSSNEVDLSWGASEDGGVGLAGYKVFRDGTQIATALGTAYSDKPLASGTEYCYQVAAYDTLEHVSAPSAPACARTFVPLGSLLGTYTGLVVPTNAPTHANSGSIKIVVGKGGKFAASLSLGGLSSAFKGQFDDAGNWVNAVLRKGLTPVQVILHLDVAEGTDQITGTVSDDSFRSELTADRAVFSRTNPCPWAGNYTVVLASPEGTNADIPQGFGYGTLTVATTGAGKLSGVLADGTKVKGSAPVSRYGTWPLYELLYQNHGACLGWVMLGTNGTVEATVDWFRPAMPASSYFPDGFTTNVTLKGERFVSIMNGGPNPAGQRVITLGGGNLVSNIVKAAVVDAAGDVTISSPGSENLQLQIQPTTGQFSGSFTHPLLNTTIGLKGVILQLDGAGGGYFLGTDESGFVVFEPAP